MACLFYGFFHFHHTDHTADRCGGGLSKSMPYGDKSAKDEQRALLDQLMGMERDVADEDKNNRARQFSDEGVDMFFLCGIQPHALLKNTKSASMVQQAYPRAMERAGVRYVDVYSLEADDGCKEQWEQLSQKERDGYGFEAMTWMFCDELVNLCNRKVARNQERPDVDIAKNEVRVRPTDVLLACVDNLSLTTLRVNARARYYALRRSRSRRTT
jgi:hypothetical protein